MLIGGVLYILIYAWMRERGGSYTDFSPYIWLIFALDVFAMGIIYKLYYGRSMLNELSAVEEQEFDEKTHTYKNKKMQPVEDLDIHYPPMAIDKMPKLDEQLITHNNKENDKMDEKESDKKDEKENDKKDDKEDDKNNNEY